MEAPLDPIGPFPPRPLDPVRGRNPSQFRQIRDGLLYERDLPMWKVLLAGCLLSLLIGVILSVALA